MWSFILFLEVNLAEKRGGFPFPDEEMKNYDDMM
jgi:hypothetical protein